MQVLPCTRAHWWFGQDENDVNKIQGPLVIRYQPSWTHVDDYGPICKTMLLKSVRLLIRYVNFYISLITISHNYIFRFNIWFQIQKHSCALSIIYTHLYFYTYFSLQLILVLLGVQTLAWVWPMWTVAAVTWTPHITLIIRKLAISK